MYTFILPLHSLFRWLVLLSLIYSIYIAYRAVVNKKRFTPHANGMRHWTATISQVQLLIGMTVYFQSPVVLLRMPAAASLSIEQIFFRYIHISLMMLAVVLITVGSAKAKRLSGDLEKYKTMLRWFVVAVIIIIIAIPWPFSPFAIRPYARTF